MVAPEDMDVTNYTEVMLIFPCVAYSKESTLAISWLQNGRLVSSSYGGINITTTSTRKANLTVVVSFLQLCVSSSDHIGSYSCALSLRQQVRKERVFHINSKFGSNHINW